MKILVTGGAGFIGSHVAEFYAEKGNEVVVLDNLSRDKLLNKNIANKEYNWNYLKKYKNVKLIKGDIRDFELMKKYSVDCDTIVHTAAQTAVTTSVTNPSEDFSSNAIGTFNMLESARINNVKKIVYCSTNKVYGENVNNVGITQTSKRYNFEDDYKNGIPENFPIDLCEHTPYGCSKLTGDIYCQDYSRLYGISAGIFRMSCIYGTRQFGVEDQGWVAWFTIASILKKPITIYGDGKQVRDVLYIKDLINAYNQFLESKIKTGVYNMGGGSKNTLSLLELVETIKDLTKISPKISYSDWRPSDQKVYISNIAKVQKELNWKPTVTPKDGVAKLVEFVNNNKSIF